MNRKGRRLVLQASSHNVLDGHRHRVVVVRKQDFGLRSVKDGDDRSSQERNLISVVDEVNHNA